MIRTLNFNLGHLQEKRKTLKPEDEAVLLTQQITLSKFPIWLVGTGSWVFKYLTSILLESYHVVLYHFKIQYYLVESIKSAKNNRLPNRK